jgi:hypothetical protein
LILNRITAILAAYRKYCATSSSAVSVRSHTGLHNAGCTRTRTVAAVADSTACEMHSLLLPRVPHTHSCIVEG